MHILYIPKHKHIHAHAPHIHVHTSRYIHLFCLLPCYLPKKLRHILVVIPPGHRRIRQSAAGHQVNRPGIKGSRCGCEVYNISTSAGSGIHLSKDVVKGFFGNRVIEGLGLKMQD